MPKGFLKAAMSPFVEFDDDPGKTKPKPKSGPQPVVIATGNPAPSFQAMNVPTSPISDAEIEKFEKHFDDLLKGANLPGPDYYEFSKVEETLVQHIADDKTRLTAAFAGLAVQGLTKQRLVESAQQYVAVIEKDRTGFQEALQEKMQSEVGSRKAKLAETEKSIADSKAQIELLQRGMEQAVASLKDEQEAITEAETRINKSGATFALACDAYTNKIKSDVTKIQNLL